MPYSTHDRAAFVALLHHLAPGADRTPILRFTQDLWTDALDELGADPGFDQARAGLLRLLADRLEEPLRGDRLDAARRALDAYPDEAAEGDPAVLVVRHPAWVGLASLELSAAAGPLNARAIDRAVALASAGFHASSRGAVGRGEVLWAMAEQADEAAWHDRSEILLREALRSPFEDPSHRPRVRLLLGLRLAEDGDADEAARVLEQVVADDAADGRAQVHALWVLAALHRGRGETNRAAERLREALDRVDDDEDEAVVERLREALRELGGPENA